MAPKHDEIVRHTSDGWAVAWDANTVEPATRRAFDKVIDRNARALRAVLGQTGQPSHSSKTLAPDAVRRRTAPPAR